MHKQIRITPTKKTPKEYLIYLANWCNKEIKEYQSYDIKCREQGRCYNENVYAFQELVEKVNKAGLKTDINGKIT